jgi:hypothetical protein
MNKYATSIEIKTQKPFLAFHLIFTALSILILVLPMGVASGIRVALLVLLYNLSFPFWAKRNQFEDLFQLWSFLLPLSIFQVFPDWFLSAQLKILVFPADGFWKIGTVSGYMAGLWVLALMPVLYVGLEMQKKYSLLFAYFSVGFLALVIFGIAEETMWMIPIWYAQNVWMIGHTAIYVLLPEVILGMVAFYAFQETKDKTLIFKVIAAYLVMLVYTGALMFAYFFIG